MTSPQQIEKEPEDEKFIDINIERSSIIEFERIEKECQNYNREVSQEAIVDEFNSPIKVPESLRAQITKEGKQVFEMQSRVEVLAQDSGKLDELESRLQELI